MSLKADCSGLILNDYIYSDAVLEAEASLMAEAERKSGLSDWGEDSSFLTGLRMHIADLLQLKRRRQDALRPVLISLLVQRLNLISDGRREPTILEEDVGQPVFIIGVPRSGTTYTHALLALDPLARSPLAWEAAFPSPPPEVATFETDPRIERLGAAMEAMMQAAPDLRNIHVMRPRDEAECEQFVESNFSSLDLWASFGLRETGRWIAAGAHEGFYAWHRRMLQQFQWRGPRGRWTLKSPDHLFRVPNLIDFYPDACLVQTHRDPAKTLPSHASLVFALHRLADPDTDPREVGREVLEVWTSAYRKAADIRRDPRVSARILDIAYSDVVANPVGTVARIHKHFGLPFTLDHERRIRLKMELDQRERTEPHRYAAEDFGLDTDSDDFAEYRKVFGHLI
jgi:hypothetical protein